MTKPGRKSAASLAVITPASTRKPASPPTCLSKTAKKHWRTVIAEWPAEHFMGGDLLLLEQYVTAIDNCRIAEAKVATEGAVIEVAGVPKVNPWQTVADRESRRSALLAGKLRISPVNRYQNSTTANRAEQAQATAKAHPLLAGNSLLGNDRWQR